MNQKHQFISKITNKNQVLYYLYYVQNEFQPLTKESEIFQEFVAPYLKLQKNGNGVISMGEGHTSYIIWTTEEKDINQMKERTVNWFIELENQNTESDTWHDYYKKESRYFQAILTSAHPIMILSLA